MKKNDTNDGTVWSQNYRIQNHKIQSHTKITCQALANTEAPELRTQDIHIRRQIYDYKLLKFYLPTCCLPAACCLLHLLPAAYSLQSTAIFCRNAGTSLSATQVMNVCSQRLVLPPHTHDCCNSQLHIYQVLTMYIRY